METFTVIFPVSGVETSVFFPPLVAMAISFITSMGGISGAFLLLPFQMSVLHYTTPSVSGTNHVFNVFAIPGGVYRYLREGRMAWPLAWVIIAGTLPGVFLGYFVRVWYLPDPRMFKLFAGSVLLYVGIRLFGDLAGKAEGRAGGGPDDRIGAGADEMKQHERSPIAPGLPPDAIVRTISVSAGNIEYEYRGERFSFYPPAMFFLALVVGIIGGAYGIGGGAIIAPFCVAVFRLPVYTIAGAALLGTFITSVAGAVFFTVIPAAGGLRAMPDWFLGILFGLGGFIGMYLGARFQKFVPQNIIKGVLGAVIVLVSLRYIVQYFL